MKASTGIELDTARSHVGETLRPVYDTKFGCSKLSYFHESFTKPDSPWTKGTGPRVLFLDAVCFGKQMPTISKMMAQAAFGPDTVVALMGQALSFGPESSLELAGEPI